MTASTIERLLGTWQLDAADEHLEMNDPVEMEFRPGGELIYAVQAGGSWQIMRLTYRVEGSRLITDQPSSPREESTAFKFDAGGALVLDYGGATTVFVRGPKRAPDV